MSIQVIQNVEFKQVAQFDTHNTQIIGFEVESGYIPCVQFVTQICIVKLVLFK